MTLGLLLLIPALLFGLPYAYRMATNSWAGESMRPNTLTGTWYGFADPGRSDEIPTEPVAHGRFRVKLSLHMRVFGITPAAVGRLTLCDTQTGQQKQYDAEDQIYHGGDEVNLSITDPGDHIAGTILHARWSDQRFSFQMRMDEHSPYGVLHDHSLLGTLSKTAPASDAGACASM